MPSRASDSRPGQVGGRPAWSCSAGWLLYRPHPPRWCFQGRLDWILFQAGLLPNWSPTPPRKSKRREVERAEQIFSQFSCFAKQAPAAAAAAAAGRHLLVQLPHSLVLVRTAAPHLLHLGLSFHDSTTLGWKAGPTPPGPGPWARTPCSVPGCHKLRKLAN